MDPKTTEAIVKHVMEGLAQGKIDKPAAVQLLKAVKQGEAPPREDVAIIGVALKMPGASNLHDFWEIVSGGVDEIGGLSQVRKRDVDAYLRHINTPEGSTKYIRGAFLDEIDGFDYGLFRLSPKEAALMDPAQRLFLQTVWHAIEDAGYGGRKLSGTSTGVYLAFATYPQANYGRMIYDVDPQLLSTGMVGNMPALIPSRISYLLDLRGPTMVIDSACSASLVAVHLACQALQRGECTMAIAGGMRVNLLPVTDENLMIGIESEDGCTRTYDDGSNGTGLGEGVAALLLKPLSVAKKDGDHIYAVIKGTALNQDGSSIGITAPNPAAQEEVLVSAWKDAKIDPESIGYIEAHGTGTKLGDPIEIEGLERAFSRFTDKRQFCAISTVKSNMGHLFECAGMAGLIKAMLALRHGQIPPSVHFGKPNHRIDFSTSPVFVNTRLRQWETNGHPRRCGVSSFGLSGTNAHIVLEEYTEEERLPEEGSRFYPHVLTLSARSPKALSGLIRSYQQALSLSHTKRIADICFTANTGRGHYGSRAVMIVREVADAVDKLGRAKQLLPSNAAQVGEPWFYYGDHKIVPETKRGPKADGEITERERMQLTRTAKEKLHQYVSEGRQDAAILHEICELYVRGADVDWEELYADEPVRKVSLPGYPFESERCWLEIPDPEVAESALEKNGLFYAMNWTLRPLEDAAAEPKGGGTYLVFKDRAGLSDQVVQTLRAKHATVIEVEFTGSFSRPSPDQITMGDAPGDYTQLAGALAGTEVTGIFHMATVDRKSALATLVDFEERQARGVYGVYYLLRALAERNMQKGLRLLLVSNSAYAVTGTEAELKPENCPLFGLGKVMAKEQLDTVIRGFDVDDSVTAEAVIQELHAESADYLAAYRNRQRYVEEFAEVDLGPYADSAIPVKDGGVYVITGGTGGIGLAVSKLLAAKAKVRLALVNRSVMPDRSQWDAILAKGVDSGLCRRIRGIQEIESTGSQVHTFRADCASPADIERVIGEIRSQFGRIDGVVHGAGVPNVSLASRQSAEFADEVFRPKVQGAWALDQATAADQLDFFVMFSSAATMFAGMGQGEYAAANSFLDGYAAYRQKAGRNSLTINWTTWKETGMAADVGFVMDTMFKALPTAQAVQGFEVFLSAGRGAGRVLIGELNFEANGISLLKRSGVRLAANIEQAIADHLTRSGTQLRLPQTRKGTKSAVKITGKDEADFTPTERVVAQVWGDVLGFDEINVYDDFIALGGDSILGLKVANKLSDELGRTVNLADMLTYTTVSDLAERIVELFGELGEDEDSGQFPPLTKVEERPYYPVSPLQRGLYLLHQLDDIGTSYNMPFVQVMNGEFDTERFQWVLRQLVERHESLRTSFDFVDGEPVQIIHPHVDVMLECTEIPEFTSEEEGYEQAKQVFDRFLRPFDLTEPPLVRFAVAKLPGSRFMLMYDIHHIISDGISNEILIGDFLKLYQGEQLPPLTIQYKDYSVWMKELCEQETIRKQEQFWLEKFSGEIPVLNLPTDFPRPLIQSFEGGHVSFTMNLEQTQAFKKMVQETGATLYSALLAVLNVVLWKYTNQEDIVIGSPVAGRVRPELERVAGLFVNTLLMRNHPSGEKQFSEFLDELKQNSIEAFGNQHFPFSSLVEKVNTRRDLSRNPMFDVMFVLLNYGVGQAAQDGMNIGEPIVLDKNLVNAAAKFDLSVTAMETADGMLFDIEYCTKLFREESMHRFAAHFVSIAERVAKRPWTRLAQISLTSEEEQSLVLERFNATDSPFEQDATLPALFERQVRLTPHKTALVYQENAITYEQLNRQANALASLLRSKGVTRDSLVAVMTERSPLMVVAALAVLKAGGAYLPIDPEYPADRIRYMLEDSGARLMLTHSSLLDRGVFDLEVMCLDDLPLTGQDETDLPPVNAASDMAYVIYTSGTTGKPKGVMVEHRNVVAYVHAFCQEFGPLADETVLQTASFSFDTFVEEVYPILLSGGKLVIPTGMEFLDMETLSALVRTHNVSIISTTPLLCAGINAIEPLESVHTYISGGDVLKHGQVSNLVQRARVYNTYGPTETTVCATYYRYAGADQVPQIPIGKPIANYRAYVLDGEDRLQPVGVPGELCIAGAGVTRGYLNRPDLTEERFVPDPFVQGGRMYRTGDMVRWLPDGAIEFMGRVDRQVKIRGFRVELGEVENSLSKHASVRDVVVTDLDRGDGKVLVAYFTASEELPVQTLRDHMRLELPDYMVPGYFVQMNAIPMTAHGKVDLSKLPKPEGLGATLVPYVAPRNDQESKLVEVWMRVLGVDRVGIDDNFFDLGGNSIKAIQMVAKLRTHFVITVNDIFMYQTVRAIAGAVYYSPGLLKEQFEAAKAAFKETTPRPEVEVLEAEERLVAYREQTKGYETIDLSERKVYRDVLVAGGTGYLGAYLTRNLLTDTSGTIHLLVRGDSPESAALRLKGKLDHYFGEGFYDNYASRIVVHNGDVTRDLLGLNADTYASLAETVDCVINSAANIRHFGPYQEFYEINVRGTERLLQFAVDGQRKDFNHISTISVGSGQIEGRTYAVFTEFDYDIGQIGGGNYEQTKIEAERVVLQARENGLTVNIFRPGNLTFNSVSGTFQENISDNAIYRLMRAAIGLGKMPYLPHGTLDFSFIDHVGKAFVLLFDKVALQNETHHLYNPVQTPVVDFANHVIACGYDVDMVPLDDFLDYLYDNYHNESLSEYVETVIPYIQPGDRQTHIATVLDKTELLLSRLGFEWPVLEREHVRKMLEHCQAVQFLPGKPS